jgi:hypothetical protein
MVIERTSPNKVMESSPPGRLRSANHRCHHGGTLFIAAHGLARWRPDVPGGGTIANRTSAVYPSRRYDRMPLTRIIDSPFPWAVAGFVVGLALGVTTLSVWLLAIGLGAFLLYLRLHGPARRSREGWLFAAGPTLMMSWVLGFVVRALAI